MAARAGVRKPPVKEIAGGGHPYLGRYGNFAGADGAAQVLERGRAAAISSEV